MSSIMQIATEKSDGGHWKGNHSTKVITFNYQWNITDLEFLMYKLETSERLMSPIFYVLGKQCQVYITKSSNIYYCLILDDKNLLNQNYLNNKLEVYNEYGKILNQGTKEIRFNCFLNGSNLTILLEVNYLVDYDPSPRCSLQENLGILYLNEKHSDVVLSVSQKEFYAHKFILAAQSTVFQEMFQDSKEASLLTITNVDHDIFKEMLHYIYTGNVFDLKTTANNLFVSADKYALRRLKIICAKQMCSNLSFENACEFLILSDSHNEEELKAKTLIFINMYADEVIKTNGWRLMIQSHPHLIEEVFKSLAIEDELWKIAPKVTSEISPGLCVEKNYIFTYLDNEKVKYPWTINKFDLCTETYILQSPKFYVKEIDWGFFYLQINLKAYYEFNENNSVSLIFIQNPVTDKQILSKISLKINNDVFTKFGELGNTQICSKLSILNCLKQELLFDPNTGSLFDDKLTIYFEGKMITDDNITEVHKEVAMFEVPDSQLQSDLNQLLKNHKYSDVSFVVSGKEIQAHTPILSARSDVFRAMFEHEMEEKLFKRVNITDISEEVFQKVLEFVYTDCVANINEMTEELLLAAEKYALERLKMLCVNQLCSNFLVENVTEVLLFADVYDFKELKDKAIHFIINNSSEVMKISGWKSMLKTHALLVSEICEKIVNYSAINKLCANKK